MDDSGYQELYVAKAERKNRTCAEVDQIICKSYTAPSPDATAPAVRSKMHRSSRKERCST
jgi:hypothetical protein